MRRLIVLRVLLLLVVTVFVGRLYQLQVVNADIKRYGGTLEVSTTRYVTVAPRRGEIFARDGKTLLAESVPIYNIAVLPGSLPPIGTERRGRVLAELAHIAVLTGTLTISPGMALEQRPTLRSELSFLGALPAALPANTVPLTLTVAPHHALDALRVSQTYSDVLTFNNPIEALINRDDVRPYQTVIVKEDISQETALVVRENSVHLPGAAIVEGYRRRYPQSGTTPSLSHVLGYTGRISECELSLRNPSSSWINGLLDTVSHAANCGLARRQIDPNSVGFPIYAPDDRLGKDGLEASYETELRGSIGIEKLLVDALQRPVSATRTVQPVRDGYNLVLTVDLDFQRQVETILKRWIDESEARRKAAGGYKSAYPPITNGVAIALDPRNGEVLAMVSLPSFDNNIWVDPTRSNEIALFYPQDPKLREEIERLAPLTNRAIAGQYPAGSTLKQFVGAIGLQLGVIAPDTKLRDPGTLRLIESSGALFELPNSTRRDNGEITVSDALKVSSNVFFASIAGGNDQVTNIGASDFRTNGINIERLAEGLKWFGLGRPTGIRLAGEASGLVPTPTWKAYTLREPWTTGNTYNAAIGQGYLEVTPLQLVNGAVAIASGKLYQPQIVRQITDNSGSVIETVQGETPSLVPVEPGYLAVVREGMRRSVTEGINIAARDDCSGLSIAGKTGTAEFGPDIKRPDGGTTRRSHSWFVGFAPYDNPQIAVAVLLEGTGDLNDGSSTLAVPAVTQIMQAYFKVTPPDPRPLACPALPQ